MRETILQEVVVPNKHFFVARMFRIVVDGIVLEGMGDVVGVTEVEVFGQIDLGEDVDVSVLRGRGVVGETKQ